MKKLLIGILAVSAMALSACGSPCDTLATTCSKCTGTAGAATGKSLCDAQVSAAKAANAIVAGTGDKACQAVIDAKTYEADSTACK